MTTCALFFLVSNDGVCVRWSVVTIKNELWFLIVAHTDEMERLCLIFGYMSFERKNELFDAVCFSLFAVEVQMARCMMATKNSHDGPR